MTCWIACCDGSVVVAAGVGAAVGEAPLGLATGPTRGTEPTVGAGAVVGAAAATGGRLGTGLVVSQRSAAKPISPPKMATASNVAAIGARRIGAAGPFAGGVWGASTGRQFSGLLGYMLTRTSRLSVR